MKLDKHIDAATAIYKETYNKLDKWQRAKTAEGEEAKQRSYRLTREAANEEHDAYIAKYNGQLEEIISQHKAELEKVEAAYLQEVADYYRPNGELIDQADKALLDSGIMNVNEFEEMAVKHAANPTMLRIMGQYSQNYEKTLDIKVKAALFGASNAGNKEKSILKSFEQLMNAPISMAQQGLAGSEVFMNTALLADEYAEGKKVELMKSKIYISDDELKVIKEYEKAEGERQSQRNKGKDWMN